MYGKSKKPTDSIREIGHTKMILCLSWIVMYLKPLNSSDKIQRGGIDDRGAIKYNTILPLYLSS